MKLDHDLTRSLLLHVEEITDGQQGFPLAGFASNFPDYPPGMVRYHAKYLCDAALVEHNHDEIYDLTPHGRACLDNIRNQKAWTEAKAAAAKKIAGQVSLDILGEIAKGFLLKALGI